VNVEPTMASSEAVVDVATITQSREAVANTEVVVLLEVTMPQEASSEVPQEVNSEVPLEAITEVPIEVNIEDQIELEVMVHLTAVPEEAIAMPQEQQWNIKIMTRLRSLTDQSH
jgi:hypothetical protein